MKNFVKYILVVILTAAVVAGVWFAIKLVAKKDIKESESIENVVENTTNITDDNNTKVANSNSYDEANVAIRKALKDKSWLKENEILLSDEVLSGFPGLTAIYHIIKLNNIDGVPAYLVSSGFEGNNTYVHLVTYKNGSVIVSERSAGSDYTEITVDVNKNIIKAENMSVGYLTYYKIEDNDIIQTDYYTDENLDEANQKYQDYNFEEISIELTNENIDAYVK